VPPSPALSTRLLREYIAAQAPQRERAIATVNLTYTATLLLGSVFLQEHRPQSLSQILHLVWPVVALAGATAGFAGLLVAIRRGHYRPWMTSSSAALEVAVPLLVTLAIHLNVPGNASTEVPIFFVLLVVPWALRARPVLAIAQGLALGVGSAIAGIARLGIAGFLATEALSGRMIYFSLLGLAAGLTAYFLVRQSEQALAQTRGRDLFGKYLLGERIGTGGMAEVFKATYCPEGGFEKPVAVKRILPVYAQEPDFVSLFRREAELCSGLNHPNLVQILDLVRHQDSLFLVMELVEGMSLKELQFRLRGLQTRLPFAAVSYVALELASGLSYLHGRRDAAGTLLGLVHRDVNPPNILLSWEGDVKLGDFGIMRAAAQVPVTANDMIRGKPGYLAPEQALGEPLDSRVVLFGVGLTLHELLTGKRLLDDTQTEQVRRLLHTDLPPPSLDRPDTPAALDQLVRQLLARSPDQRTRSADALSEALLALPGDAAPLPLGKQQLAELLALAADPAALSPTQRDRMAQLKTRPMPKSGETTAEAPTLQSTRV
jgi:serine/threonine protein kinase